MSRYVDFSQGDIIKLFGDDLKLFKKYVDTNESNKRYRFCMQDSSDNLLQDMFICRKFGDYCRPDKHINNPESHTIIEGSELIVLFDDNANIIDWFVLNKEKGLLSYRINSEIFHMTIVLSEYAIDYEVKMGPYKSDSNIYADWAPDGLEIIKGSEFITKVLGCILEEQEEIIDTYSYERLNEKVQKKYNQIRDRRSVLSVY